MLRLIFVLAPLWLIGLLPMAGCSSTSILSQLDTHVMVSVDNSRCLSASQWAPIYLGQRINDQQCQAIVEGMKARELLRLLEAQQQGGKQ